MCKPGDRPDIREWLREAAQLTSGFDSLPFPDTGKTRLPATAVRNFSGMRGRVPVRGESHGRG